MIDFAAIPKKALLGVSPATLLAKGVSPATLLAKGVSPATLQDVADHLAAIKIAPGFYRRLVDDVSARRLCHKQSTYGEDDPQKNTCGTPMCTAGHLVFAAGENGVWMAKRFGYAGAGAIIHAKLYPDHPQQDFGGILQDWAMAYLEWMASEDDRMAAEAAGSVDAT